MRSDAPPLLPVLRSRTQAGVLTVLLLNPDREMTQTELAGRIGAPLTSVVDEVRRLEKAGILASRAVGRARLVRAGSGPLVGPLTELVMRAFGPVQVVAEEFGPAAGDGPGTEVTLFGSWAARYHGEPGAAPADIDVLVVTPGARVDRDSIYLAADRAERRLGRPVNPTLVTAQRWALRGSGEDPFVDEIASRPMVGVVKIDEEGWHGSLATGCTGDRTTPRASAPGTSGGVASRRSAVAGQGQASVGDRRHRRRGRSGVGLRPGV